MSSAPAAVIAGRWRVLVAGADRRGRGDALSPARRTRPRHARRSTARDDLRGDRGVPRALRRRPGRILVQGRPAGAGADRGPRPAARARGLPRRATARRQGQPRPRACQRARRARGPTREVVSGRRPSSTRRRSAATSSSAASRRRALEQARAAAARRPRGAQGGPRRASRPSGRRRRRAGPGAVPAALLSLAVEYRADRPAEHRRPASSSARSSSTPAPAGSSRRRSFAYLFPNPRRGADLGPAASPDLSEAERDAGDRADPRRGRATTAFASFAERRATSSAACRCGRGAGRDLSSEIFVLFAVALVGHGAHARARLPLAAAPAAAGARARRRRAHLRAPRRCSAAR